MTNWPRQTPLIRKKPIARGKKSLAPRSKRRGEKRAEAVRMHCDCEGVAFLEAPGLFVRGGTIHRVDSDTVRDLFFDMAEDVGGDARCASCRAMGVDIHHLVGGVAGRDDSFANLLLLCRACHDKLQSDKKNFGYLLFRKWSVDRWHTSWRRIQELRGRSLSDVVLLANPV